MNPVAETIEALADSLVATRPDRNTIVASLKGLARIAVVEHQTAPQKAMAELDGLFKSWNGKQV
jgi:hypothetical protein